MTEGHLDEYNHEAETGHLLA